MGGRFVAWRSWNEWEEVGGWLLSADREQQRRGLERVGWEVAAWRVHRRVPLAMETTASLVEALQLEQDRATGGGEGRAPALSEYSLRLRFALPIIKLVNGVADSQQKGRMAVSVAMLADIAGLPRTVVDIRHEATHHELPSIHLLRVGVRQSLEWLRNSYWGGQAGQLCARLEGLRVLVASIHESCRDALLQGRGADGAAYVAEEDEDDDEDEEDRDGEAAPSISSGGTGKRYVGAENRRRRKELISNLRAAVPGPHARYIADVILDTGCIDPPPVADDSAGVGPSDGRAAKRGGGAGGGVAAGSAGAVSLQHAAWMTAVRLLGKAYPILGSLLLLGAVRRLAGDAGPSDQDGAECGEGPEPGATSGGRHSSSASQRAPILAPWAWPGSAAVSRQERCAAWLRWALCLLPADSAPGKSKKPATSRLLNGRKRKQPPSGRVAAQLQQEGAGPGCLSYMVEPLSGEKLCQLAETLLLGPEVNGAAAARVLSVVCKLLEGREGQRSKGGQGEDAEGLARRRALLRLAALSPGLASVGLAATGTPLTSATAAAPAAGEQDAMTGSHAGGEAEAGATAAAADDASQAAELASALRALAEQARHSAQADEGAGAAGASSGPRAAPASGPRWQVAAGLWASCAIGTMPCTFNPGGRPCFLDAEPEAGVEQVAPPAEAAPVAQSRGLAHEVAGFGARTQDAAGLGDVGIAGSDLSDRDVEMPDFWAQLEEAGGLQEEGAGVEQSGTALGVHMANPDDLARLRAQVRLF